MLAVLSPILAAALLPLQYGLHMAILNAPMEYMGCDGVEGPGQDCIPGWSPAVPSSIYAIGGLMGSAVAGNVINRRGLRHTMLLCSVIFIFGALLVAAATSMSHLCIGRLVAGIAAGGAIVVSPIYVSELAPVHLRGILGTTTQFAINFGIVLAQVLGLVSAEKHWRTIFWVALLIAVVTVVLVYFLAPEVTASASAEDSTAEPASEQLPLANSITFLTNPKYRYALITTVSIFTFQQLTGINAITQYGVRVLADAMPERAKLINFFLSFLNFAMTGVGAALIDKFGRKQLLIVSLSSMGVFTGALAFGLVRGLAGFSTLAAFATIAAFATGIGPIPFLYVSEITPREAVGAAQSLGTVSSWLSTFAVLAFFPALKALMGPSVFYLFSLATIASAAWYYKWLLPDK